MLIHSFPPVGSDNPHILILGSMPGEVSLAAHEYYAHPRNSFWPIMGKLFGAGRELPYQERLEILADNNIALWESLASCVRPGSLDSAITQEIPNDFVNYFSIHHKVTHVFFNGAKAEESFRRHVAAKISASITLQKLPSTSPAYAGMNFEKKLERWMQIKKLMPDKI